MPLGGNRAAVTCMFQKRRKLWSARVRVAQLPRRKPAIAGMGCGSAPAAKVILPLRVPVPTPSVSAVTYRVTAAMLTALQLDESPRCPRLTTRAPQTYNKRGFYL